jgi:hypothetical protein
MLPNAIMSSQNLFALPLLMPFTVPYFYQITGCPGHTVQPLADVDWHLPGTVFLSA